MSEMITMQDAKALYAALAELVEAGHAMVPHMPAMNAKTVVRWDDAMTAADEMLQALDGDYADD